MFRKIQIGVALICLAVFGLACISAFDEDIPDHFLNSSVFKIKNPASSCSKEKPEKSLQAAPGRAELPEPGRTEEGVTFQTTGGLSSFQGRSVSGRAPPARS